MKVEPISEKEAAEAGLRKRGLYDFEVLESKERISGNGNEMIELKVKLFDEEGRSFNLFDYLVSSPGMAYKVRHYASATNQLALYEKGELKGDDQVGKTGKAQLGIQAAKGGYPAKNVISDYLPVIGAATPRAAQEVADELDDEVPF